jgi:hypothetical protein
MAGVRPRRAGYPALRLATAIATMAFLLVIGVDVLNRIPFGFPLGAAAPAPAPAEQLMVGAELASEVPAEGENAAADRSSLAPTAEAPEAFAQSLLAPTPTPPVEEPLGVGGGGALVGTPLGVGGGAAGTPSAETAAPTPTPSPTPEPTPSPIPTVTPLPQFVPAAPAVQREGGLGTIQWIELLLGGTVVAFAALSLWVRREP